MGQSFQQILETFLEEPFCEDGETKRMDNVELNPLSHHLLKWLNFNEIEKKKNSQNNSSYNCYRRSKEEILKLKAERLKKEHELFLNSLQSKDILSGVRFFSKNGVYMTASLTCSELKKHYRTLAKRLHPDLHMHESKVEQSKYKESFERLQESYQSVKRLFSE